MKKIKIAFFAEILIDDFDGASRTMFQLIRRIPTDRFEFLFFSGVGPEKIQGFENVLLPSATIPINKTYKMAIPWFSGGTIRKKLHTFQPDIIHIATPSLLGQFALKYANKHHIPVLSIYHTHFVSYIQYYLKSSPRLARWLYGMVTKSQGNFYSRCDLVYTPSEEMIAALRSWEVPPAKLKLWQRGMDTHLFTPSKRDRATLRAITGNDLPVVLFASRLVWEKNLETLCQIEALLREQKMACNLVIAGDGVAKETCQKRMPSAFFTGTVDHERLAVLYASSDIFLFTSISESYGNVVVEAMASGLPCILADGGGSRNFVRDGESGFLCSPNDAHEYIKNIKRLLTDPVLHQQFVDKGLAYTRSLNWDDLAATYFDDLAALSGQSPNDSHA